MKILFYIFTFMVFVDSCQHHQTCRACIRDFEACVWCSKETTIAPRCVSEKSISQDWCRDEIINPKSKITETPDQLEYSSNSEQVVQIKPQIIKMKLRPGQRLQFDFAYNAAEHYPVDLYFLYDASMALSLWKQYKEETNNVIQWIQTVTNNASIGFGTFIDKNVLPFTSVKNETLSYSFKHQLTLTNNPEAFVEALENVEIVKSIYNDKPNGGFDALAQAIACGEIGWRNISRKIIVFLTDTMYHAAGDGLSGGIVNPYDGGCYLKNGTYIKEEELDYPTTSIINKLASDHAVTMIFVIDTFKSIYDPLTKVINGLHIIYPVVTSTHQETVASELKRTYQDITKTLKLKVSIDSEYANKINVTFAPDCDKSECYVKQNKEQIFVGTVTVLEYFEADKIKVHISVMGINEKLTLDIDLIKECSCRVGDDSLCKEGGKRRCGICEYDHNGIGINDCPTGNNTADTSKSTCVMPNKTIECSGRGYCICGICTCAEERYRGRYCECDNEGCPKDKNDRLCGHGICQCGECNCDPGWLKNSQKTCNCEASADRCQTGCDECSGNGNCECNECKCKDTICEWDARSIQGPRCNSLPCHDCHNRQCHLLEPYALNRIDSINSCHGRVNVTSVQNLKNETTWMLCSNIRSDVGCYTNFVYRYDEENYGIHLMVQSKHNCAEIAYIYGGACFSGLILIGILTIGVWKVLSVHRDRKEYRTFMRQHQNSIKASKPNENPLFKHANTTVKNPKYNT